MAAAPGGAAPTPEDVTLSVDIALDEESLRVALLAVCKRFLPSWASVEAEGVRVKKVTGGITNALFKVHVSRRRDVAPRDVLVRAFGAKTELLIDRDRDNATFAYMGAIGFGPFCYGIFGNGRVEEWFTARPLQPWEMGQAGCSCGCADTTTSSGRCVGSATGAGCPCQSSSSGAGGCLADYQAPVAERIAALHDIDFPVATPAQRLPVLWPTLHKWLAMAADVRFDDDPAKAAAFARVRMPCVASALTWLEGALAAPVDRAHLPADCHCAGGRGGGECPFAAAGASFASDVVFCHNDLLSGNLLVLETTPLASPAASTPAHAHAASGDGDAAPSDHAARDSSAGRRRSSTAGPGDHDAAAGPACGCAAAGQPAALRIRGPTACPSVALDGRCGCGQCVVASAVASVGHAAAASDGLYAPTPTPPTPAALLVDAATDCAPAAAAASASAATATAVVTDAAASPATGGASSSAGGAGPSTASVPAAAAAAAPPRLRVIDYEYGAYNPRGFDLANHFCEHAGFDFDLDRWYPTRDQQMRFYRLYLQALADHSASSSSSSAGGGGGGGSCVPPLPPAPVTQHPCFTAALYARVNQYALASSLWWGIWALVQARHSPIDFDFMAYAVTRLTAYDKHRRVFFTAAEQGDAAGDSSAGGDGDRLLVAPSAAE